ncbi:hypothetical protein Hanom_Chr16g01449221 [Helianthus anomalus]
MVTLGESWSVSNLIHSPHEHHLSQSTVCIDLGIFLLYIFLFPLHSLIKFESSYSNMNLLSLSSSKKVNLVI